MLSTCVNAFLSLINTHRLCGYMSCVAQRSHELCGQRSYNLIDALYSIRVVNFMVQ